MFVVELFGLVIVGVAWIALRNSEPKNHPRWRRAVTRISLLILTFPSLGLFWFNRVVSFAPAQGESKFPIIAMSCFVGSMTALIGAAVAPNWPTRVIFSLATLVCMTQWMTFVFLTLNFV
jgi:hypothetical protein